MAPATKLVFLFFSSCMLTLEAAIPPDYSELQQGCTEGSVKLVDGTDNLGAFVQYCYYNVWRYVCGDSWTKETADVVCRQLGMQTEYFSSEYIPFKAWLFKQVKCKGSENSLDDCTEKNYHDWCRFKYDNGISAYKYDVARVRCRQQNTPTPPQQDCIMSLKITATTGTLPNAGFNGNGHKIVLQIRHKDLQASITGPAYLGQAFSRELNLKSDFSSGSLCVKKDDIMGVKLVAGGNDNWYITAITTSVKGVGSYQTLTQDPNFNRWLDTTGAYDYDATKQILGVGTKHMPHCGYGVEVCECSDRAQQCIFNLEVDEIRTFTSYQKYPVQLGEGLFLRGVLGVLFQITDDGIIIPRQEYLGRPCGANFDPALCSDPQFVDGKSYRVAFGVNGQIPGPTLIVHEKQTIVVRVQNSLISESISTHWHGMFQRGTPWMDGVGQISQCQIPPSSSFTYTFLADPTGTFWYHSHTGAQRTDGYFGGLIVKEKPGPIRSIKSKLGSLASFEDYPEYHTMTLLDWHGDTGSDLASQIGSALRFDYNAPHGVLPRPEIANNYPQTRSYINAETGPMLYTSGLLNGKGRHIEIPYSQTRLSTFPVQRGKKYRFRLIGAQGIFAYMFSIGGHKLNLVGTDGFWVKPKVVDYIIIQAGERYDFILEANGNLENYWIQAKTLEVNQRNNKDVAPFDTYDSHVAEGILQYVNVDLDQAPEIPSPEYSSIKYNSPDIQCSSGLKCQVMNCPFETLHDSYNMHCSSVQSLKLLEPTPTNEMPEAQPTSGCSDCLHFLNLNFEGESGMSAINGISDILPPAPPQTQHDDFMKQGKRCADNVDCNPWSLDCRCTHVIDIPYGKTVQFVVSAIGEYHNSHPVHLHGHSFHVVHIGYPEYDATTGYIGKHNSDIACDSACTRPGCNNKSCTKPRWNGTAPQFTIDRTTLRKDTIYLPAGGYVVLNILSDNPGHWFFHCHIEMHTLEGMSVVVNEALDKQKLLQIPNYFNKCGNADPPPN